MFPGGDIYKVMVYLYCNPDVKGRAGHTIILYDLPPDPFAKIAFMQKKLYRFLYNQVAKHSVQKTAYLPNQRQTC